MRALGRGWPRPGAALAAAAALVLVACAPAGQSRAAGGTAIVFVANGLDGTISVLDSATGRLLGQPLAVAGAPTHVAAGGDGSLVALVATAVPAGAARRFTLLHLVRRSGGWAARTPPLGPVPEGALLASDGAHTAAVAYGTPLGCHLAVVDLAGGEIVHRHLLPAVCGGDAIRSLAVAQTERGPTAFIGTWRWPEPGTAPSALGTPGGGSALAVDLAAGRLRQATTLTGSPERLLTVPGGGSAGIEDRRQPRLYALERIPGPRHASRAAARGEEYEAPQQWRLMGMDMATLAPEDFISLQHPPLALAAARDGRHAYGLVRQDGAHSVTRVIEIDLAAGAVRPLSDLPGLSLDLVAAADRLYAVHSNGTGVWVLDRRSGRVIATLRTGQRPVALAAAPA